MLKYLILIMVLSTTIASTNKTWSEFPYVVSITTNGTHLCSGTLIGSRTVITSASCVSEPNIISTNLRVDTYEYLMKNFQVRDVFIHPFFNPTEPCEHNIALLYLLSNVVLPIFMRSKVNSIGTITEDNIISSLELEKTTETITFQLYKTVPSQNNTSVVLIPAEALNFGTTCNCDNGGPVINYRTEELVGIVLDSDCGTNSTKNFPRIDRYQSWIQETLNKLPWWNWSFYKTEISNVIG